MWILLSVHNETNSINSRVIAYKLIPWWWWWPPQNL